MFVIFIRFSYSILTHRTTNRMKHTLSYFLLRFCIGQLFPAIIEHIKNINKLPDLFIFGSKKNH
jgi:hypothetical protein